MLSTRFLSILFIILTISTFSQHVDLQQGRWYVQSITMNNVTTNIPIDPIEFSYVYLQFLENSPSNLTQSVNTVLNENCQIGFNAHVNHLSTSSFEFLDFTPFNHSSECSSSVIDFMNLYLSFYNTQITEQFTYTIITESDTSKTFILTNNNGDTINFTNWRLTPASEDVINYAWSLDYIEINGVQQNTPNNNKVNQILLSFFLPTRVGSQVCGGFESDCDFYTNDHQFYLYNYNILTINCGNSSNFQFENDYFHIYIDNLSGPFNYHVTESNNIATLTITNTEGNTAVYTREILSTQEFTKNSVSIYPNPVNDTFTIENNYSLKSLFLILTT